MPKRDKITNSSIKNLRISDKRLNDTDISGFHARISPKGKIAYYFFYRIQNKQVNFKLGDHGDITPAQARDMAKAKAGDVANGIDVHKAKQEATKQRELEKLTKLEAFLDDRYIQWLETRNAKTAQRIVKSIKTRFNDFLDIQLAEIDAWKVEKWRNERRKQKVKPATINNNVNSLKGVLSRAVEWGVIPSHDLHKVKALKTDNTIVRYLSIDEEKRLRSALARRSEKLKLERQSGNAFRQQRGYELLPDLSRCEFPDHIAPIVILAMNTGLRKGELLSLTWSRVNLENDFITINADNAKSGKSRHIPLNKEAKAVLTNWQKDVVTLKSQQPLPNSFVFQGEEDQPISDIKKAWVNLLKQAAINDFRFHDLRHHFASKLVMAGVDLNTVRELLGHGNLDMTLRYAHLAPEHKAAAVNLIG